jgi:hypothetical protein
MAELGDLEVVHVPADADQEVPRHILIGDTVAASCRVCNRLVLRWSRMGPRDRHLYAAGIRAQMSVADLEARRLRNLMRYWGS